MSSEISHIRVGIDVTSVDDVRNSVDTFGDRYLNRIFTEHELACCVGEPEVAARSLAARFAAKEAAMKVLRPDADVPTWRSIEVHRTPSGWSELRLHDQALELAHEAGLTEFSVSMTHEGTTATAVVVGLCGATSEGKN